ncbi:MAG: flagellar hook-associated protein FlgL [Ideonella sp.]
MRVSTANSYDIGVNALQRRQSELAEAQTKLTTGKRVNRASDDPVAAARAERALAGASRVSADERSVEASKSIMVQTESALGDAGELLQQAREILVSAGNASYGVPERKNMAEQLKQIRDQLLKISNRSDGAGTYLFGGQAASEKPFVDTRSQAGSVLEQTGVSYVGAAGSSTTDAGTNLPLALDGSAIWTSTRTGNGVFEARAVSASPGAWIEPGQVVDPSALTGNSYALVFNAATQAFDVTNTSTATVLASQPYAAGNSFQVDGMSLTINGTPNDGESFQIVPSVARLNVFGSLDKAIADLQSGLGSAAMSQSVSDNLRNMDSVMGSLQSARARSGEALSRIDNASNQLASEKLYHQTELAGATDLDMIAALSEFDNKQTGYDAALKSYSMVQRMSLFQYISA